MSGGALNYFFQQLNEHSHDFDDRELNDLVKDIARLFYAREWCLSGDTSEGEWREAKREFKHKWLTPYGRRERIEEYFSQIKKEFSDMLGINDDKVCEHCKHWKVKTGKFGQCDLHHGHLDHRSDSCEKWEAKDDAEN